MERWSKERYLTSETESYPRVDLDVDVSHPSIK